MTIEEIEARLILSTKRKKRNFSLVQIADDIKKIKKIYGGLDEVSKRIGISKGMLNQFLKVDKLSDHIKKLIDERKIDSVTMVHNLSKYSIEEQNILAQYILNNKIDTQDLRFLGPFKKKYPDSNISDLVDKLIESKDKKVSVLKFYKKDLQKNAQDFEKGIRSLVGDNNILLFDTNSELCQIKITKEGESLLRINAKKHNQSLKEFFVSQLKAII